MMISPLRLVTTDSPPVRFTLDRPMNFTVPAKRELSSDCCERPMAAPPTWKVRMVSCVPGSPMDWAAMTPTASPTDTLRPRDRSRP